MSFCARSQLNINNVGSTATQLELELPITDFVTSHKMEHDRTKIIAEVCTVLMLVKSTVLLALSLSIPEAQNTRRDFIVQGNIMASLSGATSSFLTHPNYQHAAFASEIPRHQSGEANNVHSDTMTLFDAKTIPWISTSRETNESLSWSKNRYRSSTLSSKLENYAPVPDSPAHYPGWMEGYWSVNYKFSKASFPQGRKILSLRTAGAGLGTCLSLPNVGHNPPAFSAHFLKSDVSAETDFCVYEDLAYNIPRKFEAFWSQSKVLSVQTNGHHIAYSKDKNISPAMSSKCYVTGDGCTTEENENLHLPASRLAMDFEGPTRRSGRLIQSLDVSLLENFCSLGTIKNAYVASKSYSQYNINQELQTFFREIISLEQIDQNGNTILGKIRVAAFLPKYIKALDVGNDSEDYNENNAVALYDYRILMKSIDEIEASSL